MPAIALARSRGSPNTLTRIDSVVGMISAPPTPMMQRPAMSAVVEPAVAATMEPPRKVARPASSACRRPKRSPMLPAVSSRPANTMVYDATIHCNWAELAPRSPTSLGIATLMMVWSMDVTSRASTSTPRMRQRLGWLVCVSPMDWVMGRPCMMTPWVWWCGGHDRPKGWGGASDTPPQIRAIRRVGDASSASRSEGAHPMRPRPP